MSTIDVLPAVRSTVAGLAPDEHRQSILADFDKGAAKALLLVLGGSLAFAGVCWVLIKLLGRRAPADDVPADQPGLGWYNPVPAGVSSGWGEPRAGHSHEGLDFVVPVGTPVQAVGDGTVIHAGPGNEASGIMMVVDHGNGFHSRYMHLSETLISVGQDVLQGEVIGLSGKTGINNSAPHLHFDARAVTSAALDWYRARYGEPAGGFIDHGAQGVAVPSEPLGYWSLSSSLVVAAAAAGVATVVV